MSRHRPFVDNAGYTRHCWECNHSRNWFDVFGECELTGKRVHKFDSPNNQCSHLPAGCEYEYGRRSE